MFLKCPICRKVGPFRSLLSRHDKRSQSFRLASASTAAIAIAISAAAQQEDNPDETVAASVIGVAAEQTAKSIAAASAAAGK